MAEVISYIIFSQRCELKDVPNNSTNCVILKRPDMLRYLKRDIKEISKADCIKPYFIYSNAQLEEIANKKPTTVDELKDIKGFGDVKCEKYGGDIIGIVRKNM